MKIAALAFTFALVSAAAAQPIHPRPQPTAMGDVTVSTKPDQRPALEALYSVRLTAYAVLTVDCKYDIYYVSTVFPDHNWDRNCVATLTQTDGRTIAFDPAEIADKLIVPELVPLVHQWAPVLVKRDAVDVRKHKDFYDALGQHWTRQ